MNCTNLDSRFYNFRNIAIAQSKTLAIKEAAFIFMHKQFDGFIGAQSSEVLEPIVRAMDQIGCFVSSSFGYTRGTVLLFDKLFSCLSQGMQFGGAPLQVFSDILRESENDSLINASTYRRREQAVTRAINELGLFDVGRMATAAATFSYVDYADLNLMQVKHDCEVILNMLNQTGVIFRTFWRISFNRAYGFVVHVLPVFDLTLVSGNDLMRELEYFWQCHAVGNGLFYRNNFVGTREDAALADEGATDQLKQGLAYLTTHALPFPIKPNKQYQEFGIHIPTEAEFEEVAL